MKSCNSGPSVCPGRAACTPCPFNPTRHSQVTGCRGGQEGGGVRESGSGLINSLLCVKYATFTFPGLIIIPGGSATLHCSCFFPRLPPDSLSAPALCFACVNELCTQRRSGVKLGSRRGQNTAPTSSSRGGCFFFLFSFSYYSDGSTIVIPHYIGGSRATGTLAD